MKAGKTYLAFELLYGPLEAARSVQKAGARRPLAQLRLQPFVLVSTEE